MNSIPYYFIAIPVPDIIKTHLSNLQTHVKKKLMYRVWPHQDDLHVTLKFLGPVSDNLTIELVNQLQCIQLSPFEIQIKGVQSFGESSSPRVLYAGVRKCQPLQKLFVLVNQALQENFLIDKRPYIPHITLAKKWLGQADEQSVRLLKEQCMYEKETFEVNKIVLYKIHPKQVPSYQIMNEFLLEG